MKQAIRIITGVTLATAICGCDGIYDDLEDCPPYMEEVMIVTAIDAGTGKSITVSQRVLDGSLFFFDDQTTLVDYVPVEKAQLGVEKPIPILEQKKYTKGDMVYVSAWGNIGDSNMSVLGTYAIGQDDISKQFLNLSPNEDYDGYYNCPQEILFGMRQIIFGQINHRKFDRIETKADGTLKLVHEIQITQLNALLWIQVENLPDGYNPEDYYFQIERQNNGYDYEGVPHAGNELREIREVGVINTGNGFLITKTPYNLVPSLDPNDIDGDTGVTLRLFQIGTTTRAGEDIDLTGEVSKVDYGDGDYIGLYSGKTTNVYIRFPETGPGTGDIEVFVKVTPWGEIYQWTEWN